MSRLRTHGTHSNLKLIGMYGRVYTSTSLGCEETLTLFRRHKLWPSKVRHYCNSTESPGLAYETEKKKASNKTDKHKAISKTKTRSKPKSILSSSDSHDSRNGHKTEDKNASLGNKNLNSLPIQPLFPFEGKPAEKTYSAVEDEFGNLSQNHDYNIRRVDIKGGRRYLVTYSRDSFCFPSVTSVLDATMSKSMYFRLFNWKRNMVKEYGKLQSDTIVKGILQSGVNFHKQMESLLLEKADKNVISIKPWIKEVTKESVQKTVRNPIPHKRIPNTISSIPYTGKSPTKLRPAPRPSIVSKTILVPIDNIVDDITLDPETSEGISSDSDQVVEDKVKECDNVKETAADENASGYEKSVEHVLKEISGIRALESVVTHLELGYTGTFDCLAEYKGKLCVIDWKTSNKPKPTLSHCFTFPLQAAAYAGAINQDHHYPFKVENALVVIVYPNGDPAHAHFLSHDQLLVYWEEWVGRLQEYQTQFASDLSGLIL